MLSDYELFSQLCTKRSIIPPPEILNAMKIASSTGELRLPCLSIVMPICEIIGRVLTSSSTIKIVDLSDCMLISKGLAKIFEALHQGTNVTSLNLKGNNIAGLTVSQLGDIFHHNNTLKHLYLEWNNLGSDTASFQDFCNGLCTNYNIEVIDLRYNQITPHAAESLSNVLRRNKSLKVLNLAWNTLGLQGGQLLLNAMAENSSITKLNLRGNCVPDEIIESIDNITHKNQSKQIVSRLNMCQSAEVAKAILHDTLKHIPMAKSDGNGKFSINQTSILKKTPEQTNLLTEYKEKLKESDSDSASHNSVMSLKVSGDCFRMNESNNRVSKTIMQDEALKNMNLNDKLSALNKILQERIAALNILTEEITVKNTEIDTAKFLNNQLQDEVDELRSKHENFVEEKTKEIAELKETQKLNEENGNKMYNELEVTHSAVLLKNKEWESKAHRYERDIHKNSLEIISLREKWSAKSQYYENIISQSKVEIYKVKRELKERESKHRVELNVLKDTLRETTQALEQCQAQLQKTRGEFRETLINLSNVKSKLNDLEQINSKYNRISDCLQKMKEEKLLIEEKFIDSQRSIASLKRQVSALQGELIEPQRRYDLLKDELDQEKEKSARLKAELAEERSRLKEQDVQIQKMSQQITGLNSQINEIQMNHADDIRVREKDKKHLREIIANKERGLNDLKAEEAQRAGQLYAAFSKYLSSIGPTTTT